MHFPWHTRYQTSLIFCQHRRSPVVSLRSIQNKIKNCNLIFFIRTYTVVGVPKVCYILENSTQKMAEISGLYV